MGVSSVIEDILAALDGFRMCNQMDYDAYSRLHDLISSLDDPQWISVKDRLPEKPGLYLCAVGASYIPVRIMEYRPYGMYENERLWVSVGAEVNHYVYDWFVHAWMPLPEPPKEGIPDA